MCGDIGVSHNDCVNYAACILRRHLQNFSALWQSGYICTENVNMPQKFHWFSEKKRKKKKNENLVITSNITHYTQKNWSTGYSLEGLCSKLQMPFIYQFHWFRLMRSHWCRSQNVGARQKARTLPWWTDGQSCEQRADSQWEKHKRQSTAHLNVACTLHVYLDHQSKNHDHADDRHDVCMIVLNEFVAQHRNIFLLFSRTASGSCEAG